MRDYDDFRPRKPCPECRCDRRRKRKTYDHAGLRLCCSCLCYRPQGRSNDEDVTPLAGGDFVAFAIAEMEEAEALMRRISDDCESSAADASRMRFAESAINRVVVMLNPPSQQQTGALSNHYGKTEALRDLQDARDALNASIAHSTPAIGRIYATVKRWRGEDAMTMSEFQRHVVV